MFGSMGFCKGSSCNHLAVTARLYWFQLDSEYVKSCDMVKSCMTSNSNRNIKFYIISLTGYARSAWHTNCHEICGIGERPPTVPDLQIDRVQTGCNCFSKYKSNSNYQWSIDEAKGVSVNTESIWKRHWKDSLQSISDVYRVENMIMSSAVVHFANAKVGGSCFRDNGTI